MTGESVAISPLERADAPAVHALVVANRAHLDRWLRWSGPIRTLADAEAMIIRFQAKLAAGDGFHCGIRSGGALAGGVVCWYINRGNRNAEVGYWLGAVARRLGFREEGVRRESHWITDRFVDHVVYGMLDREWA